MSSALLWIVLPSLVGVALIFYRRLDRIPLIAAAFTSVFLSWIAWQFPIDVVLSFGPFSFEIFPSLSFFGRSLILINLDRPLLALIYFFLTLWILGTTIAKPPRLFIPISLICVSSLIAALSVDPFLYAAIFIAIAVLVLIPLLVSPGKSPVQGVQRFLIFQVFSVPFILFTGWILTGVEASPGNLNLILRSGSLLLLGFSFLLGLFPFHSWIPMLADKVHPYILGFLLFFLPTIASIFGLGFFDRYAWLRDSEFVYQILILIGSLSVLLSGLWAFTEHNLNRIMGFTAMMGVGFSLLGIGLAGASGVQIFFALLFPQLFGFWILSVAQGSLWRIDSKLDLQSLKGASSTSPLAVLALTLAVFSLSGLPMFASFPPRTALLSQLSEETIWAAIAALIGCVSLAAVGVKVLLALMERSDKQTSSWVEEVEPAPEIPSDFTDPKSWAFITLTVIGILGFGLFSRFFLAGVPSLASMFPQLFP
jgi:NADH:ubiquinone oxidoreductase subunit 2 (subunit N)